MTSPPLKPLFESTFGPAWSDLPLSIRDRYALPAGSGASRGMVGHLNISMHPLARLVSRLTGLLMSRNGRHVPARVVFSAEPGTRRMLFERSFTFSDGTQGQFRSAMEPLPDGYVLEHMRLGFAWRCRFIWQEGKFLMQHAGFVWRGAGLSLPLPIGWLIGRPHGEEWPLSRNSFGMLVEVRHWLLGTLARYEGMFELEPAG